MPVVAPVVEVVGDVVWVEVGDVVLVVDWLVDGDVDLEVVRVDVIVVVGDVVLRTGSCGAASRGACRCMCMGISRCKQQAVGSLAWLQGWLGQLRPSIGARRGAGGLVRGAVGIQKASPQLAKKAAACSGSSCYGVSVVLRDGSAILIPNQGDIFFYAARCGWRHTHVPRVSRTTRCLVGGHVGALRGFYFQGLNDMQKGL